MIFELTLKGFDPTTDETDHLVKWLTAPTESILDQWIDGMGLKDSILQGPIEIYPGETLDFCNGIDVKISNTLSSETPKWATSVDKWKEATA